MTRAIRALAARPGFTITAIATLALGLGVNAAIFSLTRAMLLRPPPYRDADRLATVFETNPSRHIPIIAPTPANYVVWRDRVDAFERTAIFVRVQFNVVADRALQVEGFRVDAHFFPMLAIEPALGRLFTEDDTVKGRDNVVLLTDGFWRRQFGADPAVVGRRIIVDGAPCTVVGVLPASFRIFRVLNRELDLFRPYVLDPTEREHAINVWAKLKPGVPIDQARAQLAAVYATLPNDDPRWSATANLMTDRLSTYTQSILPLLEAAVGFVLLIACANVANLLLTVAAGRRKDLAVRLALGAGRWRIARDLAGESVLLAAAGAVAAVLMAVWMVSTFNTLISYQDINRSEPFAVDGWVLAFTMALAAAIALAFGLLPVRAAGDVDVVDALKDASHGSPGTSTRRLRQTLIVFELALSIVLAASAAVVARSALALHDMPRGVAVDGVMTAQVALNDARYENRQRLVGATRAIADRLRAAPGIGGAAVINYLPLAVIRLGIAMDVEGYTPPGDQRPVTRYFVVDPDYLRVAGIPLVGGRNFSAADDDDAARVAIVSETFARRYWNGDAVGRHVTLKLPESSAFWIPRSKAGRLTVVGVARDVREDGIPDSAGFPQLYLPYAQNPTVVVTLIARAASGRAENAASAIRNAVAAVDPQLPVSYEMSFDDVVRETFARPREAAWLIGAFALLAFALAAIGVYGVMAYSTTARAKEIAIRIALGATRRDIVRLIVGQAMALTAIGVAIGIAATPLSLRLASGLLFGVRAFDPSTLAAVAAALAVVSGCAAAIPAYRAARLTEQPMR
ncbi:MAG TPA: ADOP family duplicated permease [Vicinamibacterales bacterium]|jgi:putative ABC transport system permease protein|nr:ADOP family duplicated permease [Vicinamibacterales bacterium]